MPRPNMTKSRRLRGRSNAGGSPDRALGGSPTSSTSIGGAPAGWPLGGRDGFGSASDGAERRPFFDFFLPPGRERCLADPPPGFSGRPCTGPARAGGTGGSIGTVGVRAAGGGDDGLAFLFSTSSQVRYERIFGSSVVPACTAPAARNTCNACAARP